MQEPMELALEIGFSHAGLFDPALLRALPEVRDMCASNRCRRYGRSWSCPPACGTLEETAEKMHRYRVGLLVQTTAELEDDFEAEAMAEAEKRHRLPQLQLSRPALPLPVKKALLHGGLRPPGERGVHPGRAELLLRSEDADLQLLHSLRRT